MNWPYIRRCSLAILATLLSPFVGLALGRAFYLALSSFSRTLGFAPSDISAEALTSAVIIFLLMTATLGLVWAWATE